jgi:hypothetical protein
VCHWRLPGWRLAGDLNGLGGVRERQSGGDRDGLEGAAFDPAVAAAILYVPGRDVFPGQGLELAEQAGLVALDGDQVVRAAFV